MADKGSPSEYWVVSMLDCSGFPHTTLAFSRKDAVESFLQHVYLFIHAFSGFEFRVIGEDTDGALSGLYLLIKADDCWGCVLTICCPGLITGAGGDDTYDTDRPFQQIAIELDTAVDRKRRCLEPREVERLGRSFVSVYWPRNGCEELLKMASGEGRKQPALSPDTVEHVWNAMQSARRTVQYHSTVTATHS